MVNINNFNSSLLKIGRKSYKNIDIYYIGYITIKSISDYESINSVNTLYVKQMDTFKKKMEINT